MKRKKEAERPPPVIKRHWCYILLVALLLVQVIWLGWVGMLRFKTMRVAGVDPVGYYSYLPSLIFDRDLEFADEYERLRGKGDVSPDRPRTVTGKMPNPFSVGVAILWLPFFLLGHVAALMTDFATDGFSAPYHIAVYLANAVYGFAGIVLIYRLVERLFERDVALLATTLIWFASGVLYYLFPLRPMSHMPSMFAVALFITAWLSWREKKGLRGYIALGALGGLAALVRWQNALFLVLPAMDIVEALRRDRPDQQELRKTALRMILSGIAFLVVFSPQMIVWKVLYGGFVTVPQGSGFLGWFKPALFDTLFSTRHGLISWTPVILPAIIGLFMFPTEKRRLGYLLVVPLVLQLYVNSVVVHVGWSFGMRRFMNCSAIFALGLAAFLTKAKERVPFRYLVMIAVLPIVWNELFLIQYYAGTIPRDDYLTFTQFVTDKFRALLLILGQMLS
jgi:hypothetical protein